MGCAEPVDGRWLGVDCHSDSVGCLFRHGAQPALLACVHVAIDMGGELTRGSSSDTADSGETTCDGEEDTTEIKRCLDVNQS